MHTAATFPQQMEKDVADIEPVLSSVKLKKHSNVSNTSNANSETMPSFTSRTRQAVFARLEPNK
ncbi:hypothetical protein GN244_ATG12257 [Phytophthora infestans]|uniref:Uncharacterized protein n=1 Tax=Phytophthora infestans TaxID=4787 RepID=A0A833WB90_PHYIN|nr:hypothetical protein GN244_ATG12257 [Phytophthora infestans]KAF4137111.1 hypothetical protein GN958_ATG13695 [Phytophthora infestans]